MIDARMAGGCRSAWQECALVVSLEMFNILLERCNALLKEQVESSGNQTTNRRLLNEDLQIVLPAIKVESRSILRLLILLLLLKNIQLTLCILVGFHDPPN